MKNTDHSDQDPVWDLLENASTQKADALFSRNVLREVRLEAHEKKSWWSHLLRPAPLLGSLAVGAACVALLVTSQTQTPPATSQPVVNQTQDVDFADLNAELETDAKLEALMDPLSLVAMNDAYLSEIDYLLEL